MLAVKIVFNINIAMQLTNGINNYPWKRATCVSKKKYIRSPLKKIIIIRTVSFSSQSKIRLETEEIFKKRHLALDLTLIFLYLYDTLNRLIDKKNTIRYTIKIAKKVPESCRILQKFITKKCFLPPKTLPAVFFDIWNFWSIPKIQKW